MPRHKIDSAWSRAKTTRKLKNNDGKCTRKRQFELNEGEIMEIEPEIHLNNISIELPDYTQWFNLDSINCIEKECVANIFIGREVDKNTSLDLYKTIRNKIVSLYRENPGLYLPITQCVRKLGHDASIVMKIYSLLNYWGIINYQVTNEKGERVLNKKLKDRVVDLKGYQSNPFDLMYKRPNYNDILSKRKTYYDTMKQDKTQPFELCSSEEVVRYAAELNSGFNVTTTTIYPTCSGCGTLCNTSYYILGPDTLGEVTNSVRSRGIWCTLCYCNSNYPLTFSKDNFVRIDVPPRLSETLSKLPDNRLPQCKLSDNRFFRDNMFGSRRFEKKGEGLNGVQETTMESNSQDDESVTVDLKYYEQNNEELQDNRELQNNLNHNNRDLYNNGELQSNGDLQSNLDYNNEDFQHDEHLQNNGELQSNLDQNDRDLQNNLNNRLNHFNIQSRHEINKNNGKQKSHEKQNEKYKSKEPWTAADFEKLYEAIRKYGTDWQSVAQHIGDETTPNECIFQFINAPLEREITSKLKLTTYMEPPTHEDIGPNFPFFDSPNTIVTLLSFCASVVSPVVASSAAKAAFDIILNSCKNGRDSNKNYNIHNNTNNNNKDNNNNNKDNNTNGLNHVVQHNHLNDKHNHELGSVTGNNSFNKELDETMRNGTSEVGSNGNLQRNNQENHSGSSYVNGLEHMNNGLNGTSQANPEDIGLNYLNGKQMYNNSNAENKEQSEPLNKYVEGSILQMAAAAALRAAAARAGELALMEDDRLTQVLPNLISLRIKRITEKLNKYNETQDRMKENKLELERELNNILKYQTR